MTTYEADRNGVLATKLFTTSAENTVTETSLVGTVEGSATLPAKFLRDGRTIRVTARGILTTKAAPVGNLTFRVRFGGISGTIVLTTTALAPSDGITDRGWKVEGIICCRSTGAAGTVFAQGERVIYTSATAHDAVQMVNTGTQTIDTTAAQAIVVSAEWATADVANIVRCTDLIIESLN